MTSDANGRAATIHDVAAKAQVSHQTVSRYLRFNGGLKPATSERIAAAIAELGYRPNLVARSMRTRRSGRVALIMPGSGVHTPGDLLAGAGDVIREAGFAVEVLVLEGDAASRAARVSELVDSGSVESVLSLAPLPRDEAARERGVTVVSSSDYDDDGRVTGALADSSPMRELVDGLVDLGHRRFGLVTGDLSYASARSRREVFERALAAHGLEPAFVHVGDWSAASGAAAAERVPADGRRTAVLAANDVVAGAVVRRLAERGLSVPDQVAVAGWDDHPLAGLLFPALTTVVADFRALGAYEARRLLSAMRGEPAPEPIEPGLQRVIWRESTGSRTAADGVADGAIDGAPSS